jgi:hypothetical protein
MSYLLRLRKLTTLLESVPCVERVRIEPQCRQTSETSGTFHMGIEKNAQAKAALAIDPSLAYEQDEAISRTVEFFKATHLSKIPGATLELQLVPPTKSKNAAESAPIPPIESLGSLWKPPIVPLPLIIPQQHGLPPKSSASKRRRNRAKFHQPVVSPEDVSKEEEIIQMLSES